jgi:hypothetical protein
MKKNYPCLNDLQTLKLEKIIMLNKQNVQKLITALRSGEFTQGHRRLRTNNTFCCLGVACEIYRQEIPNTKWKFSMQVGFDDVYQFENEKFHLPLEVQKWLGFATNAGADKDTFLTKMNDSGKNFSEIADYLESLLESS